MHELVKYGARKYFAGYWHTPDDIAAAPGLKFAKAVKASLSLKVPTESGNPQAARIPAAECHAPPR
ncbi:MAG: hypothetical protein JOY90_01740 [Bradyrhizobium sp.]|uniref:hypothetical protein n=1 Tax=Bradyrhizobium sp. TaxID=376 RepID=UPI001D31C4F2|nr:hypothetical protein [Bradyrhizobium sp.]MBV9559176.1 hypothetical protein [Bradyrhizobium sp.]